MRTDPAVQSTTDATFAADVLASGMPVLVEFTASWCGPCRMLAPVLQQIAVDEAARMRVVSLDVDENPATARAYGVMSMPTLVLIRDGEEVARLVGAQPRPAIMRQLEPILG